MLGFFVNNLFTFSVSSLTFYSLAFWEMVFFSVRIFFINAKFVLVSSVNIGFMVDRICFILVFSILSFILGKGL